MTESQPAPYYFISYSRQEVTFVDSLSRELHARSIRNWVDFRNLVPGQPWQPLLDEGVQNAAAILLVVSKASMSSRPVKDEWTKSLAAGRRIVLILFEPCKLDPGLAGLEWVDFTQRFDRAMDQLMKLLASPSPLLTSPLPAKQIHLPGAAITSMGLSLLLAILLIPQIFIPLAWLFVFTVSAIARAGGAPESPLSATMPSDDFLLSVTLVAMGLLWLPAILNFLWLPVQIVRRRHNAQMISYLVYALLFMSLFLLIVPFISKLTSSTAESVMNASLRWMAPVFLLTVLTGVLFMRLLVSKGMYRWSGPKGAIIRMLPPDVRGHTDNGIPMRVLIESAPQDRLYARELNASITRAGHTCTEDVQEVDIVLSLFSAYKTGSEYDPETVRLIPVLIQRCDVDKRLSRLQWMDLRHGKVSMDAAAHLLDEPNELLRLLGVLPVRMLILPGAVNLLKNLITLALVYVSIAVLLLALSAVESPEKIPAVLPFLLLPPGYYLLGRYLTQRRLRYLLFLSYGWVVGFAALLALGSYMGLQSVESLLLWLIPLLMLHRDVRLWLPPGTRGQIFGKQPAMEQPAAPQ